METGFYKLPDKKQLNSLYGVFRKQPRGSGRLHWAAERTPYGYDGLILQALRLRLRYPLGCRDIDIYITRLMIERRPCRFDYIGMDMDSVCYTLRGRGGGTQFYYDALRKGWL